MRVPSTADQRPRAAGFSSEGGLFASATSSANVARLFGRQSGIAPKLLVAAGFSYLFMPIDLIPDRLGLVGHFDEAGFILLGFAAGLLLSLISADPHASPWSAATLSGLVRSPIQMVARAIMRRASQGMPGRLTLRLMIGRWPDAEEQAAFVRGLQATSHALPPLLRAAAYVPAARPLLSRSMLLGAANAHERPAVLSDAQMMGDTLALWRGPKVRFMHLEKTAGSSLITVLAAQFHPLQIHSQTDRRHAPNRSGTEQEALAAAHREAEIVWGHYDLPTMRRLDRNEPRFTLCLLREPAERILSLYYFWHANQDEESVGLSFARANGLLAFLRAEDAGIRNDIDNMYVRRLTGLFATRFGDPLADAPEASLAAAIKALDGLDFVGLSGQLGDSLSILGRLLGFTPPERTPEVNVMSNVERNVLLKVRPTSRETITPDIEAELTRLTRLDAILYQRARRRFQSLLSAPDADPTRCRLAKG
ncbi:MAG: YkvA family protein [Janthinobacterium lividum]